MVMNLLFETAPPTGSLFSKMYNKLLVSSGCCFVFCQFVIL